MNRLSFVRAVVVGAVLAALGLPSVAGATRQERSLLVSADARYGSFLAQNAADTKDVLVLGDMTGATFKARGHRTRTSAHAATILLGRRVPFEAVVVVAGARPRRTAITVRSIEYLPGFGLSAKVAVEKRSRSRLLRRRFPGAVSPPLSSFGRATLFAAPTGINLNQSGLPTDFCFVCDYPVTLEIHSTLPTGTVVTFEPEGSHCADDLYGQKPSRPFFDVTSNPLDGHVSAFTAKATGGCFGDFSSAKWQLRVTYPGHDAFFDSAFALLNISQVGPQLYTTSCQALKTKQPLRCSGRAVSSFEHTYISLAQ